MKIILCGGSGSGKTTFKNKLVEFGFNPIIQHTNRPKRDFDSDDYIFTDKDFFNNNDFVELQYFDWCDWYYGTTMDSFDNGDVLIANPKSLEQIKQYYSNDELLIIYFNINKDTIIDRLRKRGDLDDLIKKRLLNDEKDFENFKSYDVEITDVNFNTKFVELLKKLT